GGGLASREGMELATGLLPVWEMWELSVKAGEMIRLAAVGSANARPRPSMTAPIMPPLPNGSTTDRIIPHRVEPNAYAPSRSPAGAWEKTSLMIEHVIGITMSATTRPAMNVDAVYAVGDES